MDDSEPSFVELSDVNQMIALLHLMFSRASMGVCLLDPQRVILWANSVFAQQLGVSSSSVIGHLGEEIIPGWCIDQDNLYDQTRDTGEGCHEEAYPYAFPDQPDRGTTYWNSTVSPLFGRDREFKGWLVMREDVTNSIRNERTVEELLAIVQKQNGQLTKQAHLMGSQNQQLKAQAEWLRVQNEALRTRNEELSRLTRELGAERARLRAIVDNAPVGIVVVDERCRVLFTNWTADRLHTGPINNDQGMTNQTEVMLCRPDGTPYDPRHLPLTRSALRGETHIGVEMSVAWPDGQRRELLANSVPLRDSDDKLSGAVGVYQDITELREAQQRTTDLNASLSVTAARLEGIVDNMPEGVVVLDHEGTVTLANRAAKSLLEGITVGSDLSDLMRVGFRTASGEAFNLDRFPLARALRGETVEDEEVSIFGPEGRRLDLLINVVALPGEGGGLNEVVAVLSDITPFRELDRQKDRFISVAGHELKTPLTSVKGYAQLLMRQAKYSPERPVSPSALEGIAVSAERMRRLVDDLLDVSRIQLNAMVVNREPVDLVQLIGQVIDQSQLEDRERSLRLYCEHQGVVGYWDGERISQVLTNLLDNAIKYSPAGRPIDVRLDVRGEWVEVAVQDYGIGIAEQEQNRVFAPFFRGTEVERLSTKGLGLGLYICQQIISLHGGTIWVTSIPGEGSTFAFSLPISSAPSF